MGVFYLAITTVDKWPHPWGLLIFPVILKTKRFEMSPTTGQQVLKLYTCKFSCWEVWPCWLQWCHWYSSKPQQGLVFKNSQNLCPCKWQSMPHWYMAYLGSTWTCAGAYWLWMASGNTHEGSIRLVGDHCHYQQQEAVVNAFELLPQGDMALNPNRVCPCNGWVHN